MKQYDSYKDSGVQWIGRIPSHWDVRKLKYDFQIYAGATPKTENIQYWDGDIIWITPADYKTNDKYVSEGQRTITIEGYSSCNTQLVPKGSLIFSKRAPIGTVAISGVELCTNQGCLSCVPKDVNTLFFYYLTSVYTEIFDLLGSGATFREISADAFANIKLPLPPLSEQQAIATYLDKKCGEIDKAIDTQKKRIELLQEMRQNIITHAVTRGINPDVPLKGSGVDWIGEIPRHWEMKKLKYLVSCNDDVLSESTPENQIIQYVEIGDVSYVDGITNTNEYEFKDAPSRARRITKCGDVIVSTVRTYLKAISSIKEDGLIVSTGFAVLRPHQLYDKYLGYALLSELFISEVISKSDGVSYPAINSSTLINIKVPTPIYEEQLSITHYLDNRCSEIDMKIATHKKRIDILQELKQSIITEVVTGKRNVC